MDKVLITLDMHLTQIFHTENFDPLLFDFLFKGKKGSENGIGKVKA